MIIAPSQGACPESTSDCRGSVREKRLAPIGTLQRGDHLIENAEQRRSQLTQRSERGDGDERGQQTVLDHCGPDFLTRELLDDFAELGHRMPPLWKSFATDFADLVVC